MNAKTNIIAVLGLIVLLNLPAGVSATEIDTTLDVKEIIKKIDQLYRSKSSYAELEMEIINPRWRWRMKCGTIYRRPTK
jgi:hypothetical protein